MDVIYKILLYFRTEWNGRQIGGSNEKDTKDFISYRFINALFANCRPLPNRFSLYVCWQCRLVGRLNWLIVQPSIAILCVLWTVWIANDIVCILSRLQWNFPRFHIIPLRRFLISLRTRTKFYPSIIFMNILYISSKSMRFEYNKLELRFTYLRQLLTTNFQ